MTIILTVLFIICLFSNFYWYCKSKALQQEQQNTELVVPMLTQQIQAGKSYDVYLSNGMILHNVLLLGQSTQIGDDFVLGGWEGMTIFQNTKCQKELVKTVIIRHMKEV
jgi:uncharacterized protein YpmB